MTTSRRSADRAKEAATRDRIAVGREFRLARLRRGWSIDAVASRCGISAPMVSRIERGVHQAVSHEDLVLLGTTLELDVRLRTYPGPDAPVDGPQLRLLERLRARLPPRVTMLREVPLPLVGDQRAWDAVLGELVDRSGHAAEKLPVDAETRLIDQQAQIRRLQLKLRDSGFGNVLLLLADTRRNREAVAVAARLIAADFPVPARQALARLAEGVHPGGSAIVFL